MTAPVERTITVRRVGDRLAVTVSPPLPGFDFNLEDERDNFVRGDVRSLHRHHGWAIHDETGEVVHG